MAAAANPWSAASSPGEGHQVVDPLVAGGAVAEEDEGPGALGVGRGPEDARHPAAVDLDLEAALDDAVEAVGVASPIHRGRRRVYGWIRRGRRWPLPSASVANSPSVSGSRPGGMSVGPTSPTMLGSSTPTPVPRRRSIRLSWPSGCRLFVDRIGRLVHAASYPSAAIPSCQKTNAHRSAPSSACFHAGLPTPWPARDSMRSRTGRSSGVGGGRLQAGGELAGVDRVDPGVGLGRGDERGRVGGALDHVVVGRVGVRARRTRRARRGRRTRGSTGRR